MNFIELSGFLKNIKGPKGKNHLTLPFLLVGLFVFTISWHCVSQTITTIAGDGTGGYCCDGSAATSASLYSPIGVAVDKLGNVYIADYNNSRIRKVNANGIISTYAGDGSIGFCCDGGQATSAEIAEPASIALDDSGNVYIADTHNNRIRKVSSTGVISTFAGNGGTGGYSGDGGLATAAELYWPYSIALDASGNMYIADYYNNRIRKVNSKGIINTIAGDGTGGYFGDGGSATSAEINGPEGVAVDASGNVYIGDAENQRIRKISTTGIITTIAGNGTKGYSGDGGLAANAELYYPDGIAVDDSGSIYIADSYNNRIRKINSTGIISTVIGDGTKGYSGDGGPATVAELNQTSDVFVDASSNIYIADYANNRIRKVSAPLAINEITDSKDLIIYPNPSNGEFNVALKGVTSKNKIEVFNMLGQCVFLNKLNNNLTEINLSNQPAGIYLYKEVSEQEEFISGGKIIIQ